MVIRLVLPDLRAGIIRGACLRLEEASLSNLADIEVAHLDSAVLGEEDVSTLNVSVDNLAIVKGLQAVQHLDQVGPAGLLGDFVRLFGCCDLLK